MDVKFGKHSHFSWQMIEYARFGEEQEVVAGELHRLRDFERLNELHAIR